MPGDSVVSGYPTRLAAVFHDVSGRTVTVPGVADALDGTALLSWGRSTLAALERHRDEINALNVFPVPDSDTGTNLLSTMRAAVRGAEESAVPAPDPSSDDRLPAVAEVTGLASAQADDEGALTIEEATGPQAREVAAAMARAATIGARGNSGIILSQVLRGISDAAVDGPLTERSLRVALRQAARLVREALSSPVEGTMLTVLDRAAERAADCSERDLVSVALAAADGAAKALGETPTQLGVLREAGVVDAGARGLLVLLDELVAAAGGTAPTRPEYRRGGPERGGGAGGPLRHSGVLLAGIHPTALDPGQKHAGMTGGAAVAPQYEVMFLVRDTDEPRVDALRDQLDALGDSVVVVGDGAQTWSAHVHCADAGAAVEAGLAAGQLSGIRIETLTADMHADRSVADRAILAVVTGPGAVRLFEDGGAVVLEGAVTAEVLLEAIRGVARREVLVLPNGALPAHELVAVSVAARDGQREVLMLPCGSMVQGLAALAMHDAGRAAADDAFAMSEAAAGSRWGALRVAPERALTMVGMCEAGDGLGLVGQDVVVIDSDVRAAGRTLLDRMLGLGGELVTMLIGCDAPEGLSQELAEHVAAGFPGVEVVVYPGGQAGDVVQIGVE
ncbi:DAK2 domain-containing protein [Nocardia sp. NPDC059240]|uniref:DAK2 domain-containing protein n=1 Tax=Nocardia sp. NPDC059240 TaxID=3346786 RepID=UPI0036B5FA2B